MKILKKILKIIMILLISLIAGLLIICTVQMYKPVLDARKEISDVDYFAKNVNDELINKEVKIIGLGEATHGNSEFQKLKFDVFKTLIRDNGVSTICFEMSYGEGVLINDYINNKPKMSIEELFSHISFEIYHTEEIKELIEWMKEYNLNSNDGYLEFYGYDIQNPEHDIYVINEFVKENKVLNEFNLNDSLKKYIDGEINIREDEMNEVYDSLKIYQEELTNDMYKDYYNIDRVLSCIDNVFKTKELVNVSKNNDVSYGEYRDKAMSENILDIYNQTGYPIMITGHNGHVGYAGSYVKTMGAYLKEELGTDYFVIGTDYFKTNDSIKNKNGRKNYTFYSADPLAYQAKRLGTYYLNFSEAKESYVLNEIITNKISTGSLGEGFSILNKFIPATIRLYAPMTDLYDAMIYVYEAKPITLLEY